MPSRSVDDPEVDHQQDSNQKKEYDEEQDFQAPLLLPQFLLLCFVGQLLLHVDESNLLVVVEILGCSLVPLQLVLVQV